MEERKLPLDYAPRPARLPVAQSMRCAILLLLSVSLAVLAIPMLLLGIEGVVYLAKHHVPGIDLGGDLVEAITPLLIGLFSGFFCIRWMRGASRMMQAIRERRP